MTRSLMVLVVLLMGACSASPTADEAATAANDEGADLAAAVEGVCAARDEALRSPEEAASIFLDRSHGGLHHLADAVASVDRQVAAAVHEAKQRVESAADAGRPAALQASLQDLASVSGDALRALDIAEPGCVREAAP